VLYGLKQQAETKGITKDQRNALSAQADDIRAQLGMLGYDTSGLGANVSYNNARQVNPFRTLQGQQLDMQRQQQQFDNNFALEQYAYQQARDAIADQQWKAVFDRDVQQFGLNYGLQQLQMQNDQAYRQAQLALSQDDNARQWAALDYDMANGGDDGYSGMTASQALSSARQMFKDEDGKIPTDAATKKQIYEYVGQLGLPVGQDEQVMLSLGLKPDDIAKFDEQYGFSSGE
uniref:hypothetical protein n=1 Tax=Staphylococcus warneri TaxID=1292 RepID=UPI003BA3033F